MTLNDFLPAVSLAQYVRLYRIIDFRFAPGSVLPFKAYPPRPEDCLQFFPKGGEILKTNEGRLLLNPKEITVIGQQTNLIQRHLVAETILILQVVFQPGILPWLSNLSAAELNNTCTDATEIFGKQILLINEQLHHSADYADMLRIAHDYISKLVHKREKSADQLMMVAKMMQAEAEKFSLDRFLRAAYLSHRQFDRRFQNLTGLAPKTFLQLTRFDKAFRMKNRFPGRDWLRIALANGYHDYQHLVKEYKTFTGYTPVQFLALDNQSPERKFGDAEI